MNEIGRKPAHTVAELASARQPEREFPAFLGLARIVHMQLAKIDDVERVSKMASPISKRFISKL